MAPDQPPPSRTTSIQPTSTVTASSPCPSPCPCSGTSTSTDTLASLFSAPSASAPLPAWPPSSRSPPLVNYGKTGDWLWNSRENHHLDNRGVQHWHRDSTTRVATVPSTTPLDEGRDVIHHPHSTTGGQLEAFSSSRNSATGLQHRVHCPLLRRERGMPFDGVARCGWTHLRGITSDGSPELRRKKLGRPSGFESGLH
jgi:hypothetical protein